MSMDTNKPGDKNEAPIIVRKRRKGHGHGHHGGAWKVAYADFVTAMMAFFLVMWIVGSSPQVKKSVATYFREPGVFSLTKGKELRPIPIDLSAAAGEGTEKYKEMLASLDSAKREELLRAIQDSVYASKTLQGAEQRIRKALDSLATARPEIRGLLSSLNVKLTDRGMTIELVEDKGSVFFESGSAKLKSAAVDILNSLGDELRLLPNTLSIEGHTDSQPYQAGSGYTNWELSSDRANAARRVLAARGLWAGQIQSVVGFADQQLANPEDPFDVKNRRISVTVEHRSVEDFLN